MTNRRIATLATALLGAATLAACSGASEPEAPANAMDNAVEVIDETPSENFATPEPIATPSATPTPVAEAPLPDAEQIQDDAEAVGMTARVDRSGNQATPAE